MGVGRPLPGWAGPTWVETGEGGGKGGCSVGPAPVGRRPLAWLRDVGDVTAPREELPYCLE